MKKFIKYSLFGITYLIIIYFLAIMFIVTAKADIVKPNDGIEPFQVVKIQLRGLMKNDDPSLDYGIKQTWEFAHPANKKYTGPLPKFINMIKSEGYKMLLNHIGYPDRAKKLEMALDITGQFEKKIQITGRDTGATGLEFCSYILDVINDPQLEEKWNSFQ